MKYNLYLRYLRPNEGGTQSNERQTPSKATAKVIKQNRSRKLYHIKERLR